MWIGTRGLLAVCSPGDGRCLLLWKKNPDLRPGESFLCGSFPVCFEGRILPTKSSLSGEPGDKTAREGNMVGLFF